MGNIDNKKAFSTKLSLAKFVCMVKRLTQMQRKLVCSIGLQHLLYVSCDYLHRGLIIYLVKNFNLKSRSLHFSDGSSYTISPSTVNKVLGTPIGGKLIGEKVDPDLRRSIAQLTNCKGHYPTINELDKLITPDLEGDVFKVVFTMYAMTAFLCPSSHDAVSPQYLHIVRNANQISEFDFLSAVLDKLVSCIEAYNEGDTCVLGGNLLFLMVTHFEFLDSDVIPAPSKSFLPRISVWTSALVNEVELMDCVCQSTFQYGRLPIKDVSCTPFGFMCTRGQSRVGKSYEDLMKLILSISPKHNHTLVKDQLPSIISNMYKEIEDSIEPIVVENIMSMLSLVTADRSSYEISDTNITKAHQLEFKVPGPVCGNENTSKCKSVLSGKVIKSTLACQSTPTCNETVIKVGNTTTASRAVTFDIPGREAGEEMQLELPGPIHNSEITLDAHANSDLAGPFLNIISFAGITQTSNELDLKGGNITAASTVVTNDISGREANKKDETVEMLLLPVPSNETLDKINEDINQFPSLRSILDVIEIIPIETTFDLPCNYDLLESFNPQKFDISTTLHSMPSTLEIVSYLLKDSAEDSDPRQATNSIDHLVFEKVNFSQELEPNSCLSKGLGSVLAQVSLNPNKRTTCTSKNDIAEQCVALKKRAKMFQIFEDTSTNSDNALPLDKSNALGSLEHGGESHGTHDEETMKTPDRSAYNDSSWDDEEWDRELVRSTLRVEAEHLANRTNSQYMSKDNQNFMNSQYMTEDNQNFMNYQYMRQDNENFNLEELSPDKIITSFRSTLVEREVYKDIIARVPKTTKSKTINVVRMGSTWAEHMVFALSMMIYGSVNPYVMNMLGKAVIVEDVERDRLDLLPMGHWRRYYFECDIACVVHEVM